MRTARFILATTLTLALGIPVVAQQTNSFFSGTSPSTIFTGVNPRTYNSVPFDANKAMRTFNASNFVRTPAQQKPFSLSSAFPIFHMPSWPPKIPNLSIMPQKNNPFQPVPINGINPFGNTPQKK
jgi:hypothetical protein